MLHPATLPQGPSGSAQVAEEATHEVQRRAYKVTVVEASLANEAARLAAGPGCRVLRSQLTFNASISTFIAEHTEFVVLAQGFE